MPCNNTWSSNHCKVCFQVIKKLQIVSWICNQMLPSSTWSFILKYPTDFLFLVIFDITSCWVQIPIITCTKRLKKRNIKDQVYSAIVSSQILLVSQRSNPVYNRKGTYKARSKLPVTHCIQMLCWEQHLITYVELNINLLIIKIMFLPYLNLYQICFYLLYHILNFRNPWLSSLNQMQTFNQINWSLKYLTKYQMLKN